MIFLISIALALTFTLLCGQTLRKRPALFYLGAVVIAAVGILVTCYGGTLPDIVQNWVLPILTGGGLSGGLFAIVMFTGALPNGSWLIKRLMPVRGELSILASILTIGHNIAYGKTYFFTLFTDPGKLSVWHILAASCSLAMLLLMLPLFVTSFKCIRRKMGGKTWKKLQRLAYGFYALLYIHVMLLNLPGMIAGRAGNLLNGFVYSTVFISYFICRILKQMAKQNGSAKMLARRQIAGTACAILASLTLTVCLSGDTLLASTSIVRDIGGDTEDAGTYQDGTYAGSAMGMNAPITVNVTIENDQIREVSIVSHQDDEEYFADALAVINSILNTNSTNVDTVSGATWSSGGILDAVDDALEKAKR